MKSVLYGTGIPVSSFTKWRALELYRRDVEKIYHGFGHSPVKAYAKKLLLSIEPGKNH